LVFGIQTHGFHKNLHPYPSKAAPAAKSAGFNGYGCGLPRKTPGRPATFPNRDLVNEIDVEDNKVLLAKRLAAVDKKKPTAPRAGKLAPAEPALQKKARTGIEHFADIAAREEETTHKALELKRTKFRGETEKAVAKVRAQG
jgi:hypothetical protein